eukprot:SAG31_NODE_4682_length_3034_cov_4.466780_1_plen_38_part_00
MTSFYQRVHLLSHQAQLNCFQTVKIEWLMKCNNTYVK